MKRGPSPTRGLRAAIPIALRLGQPMLFIASPACPVDFMIAAPGYLGLIRLRLTEKKNATIAEIEKDFFRQIAELSALPRGGPVSYELWLYTRHGGLRFFSVTATGIIEIDRSLLLSQLRPEGSAIVEPSMSLPTGLNIPVASSNAAPAADNAAGGSDPYRKFRRWLAKRNGALRATGKTTVLDPVVLALLSGNRDMFTTTKPGAANVSGPGEPVPSAEPVPGDPAKSSGSDRKKKSRKKSGSANADAENPESPAKIPDASRPDNNSEPVIATGPITPEEHPTAGLPDSPAGKPGSHSPTEKEGVPEIQSSGAISASEQVSRKTE
jgi:hypothetical protein